MSGLKIRIEDTIIRKPLTSFLICLFICGTSFVLVKNYTYNKNLSPLMKEILDYTDVHESEDLTPVIKNHLKIGMGLNEVVRYFEDMGFKVNKGQKDTWSGKEEYDDIYSAHFSIPIIPILAYKVYKFSMKFKDEKLVEYSGRAYSEST